MQCCRHLNSSLYRAKRSRRSARRTALRRSRFRLTASSMRRNCSTLKVGSLPDRSTTVKDWLLSMDLTKYSPACAAIPFLDSIRTRSVPLSRRASARTIMPFCSLPFAVKLLLSKLSDRRPSFSLKASPIASAAFTPKLFPSSSSFCRCLLFFSMSARGTPSSSPKPFRLTSSDMQEVLFSIACVSKRRRTDVSSMPQTVMCFALMFLFKATRICSKPPSIFFRCSSSSCRFFASSRRFSAAM
mmetsp:Transcript_16750/g.45365  ORF Transcript_16750/g.45365 Transcript_16750/m.45365 type:complete len:243 (-) Transcript_16750:299-1027(-)